MSRNLEFGIEAAGNTTLSISGPSSPLRLAGRYRELVQKANPHKPFRYSQTKKGTKAREDIGEVRVNVRKIAGISNNRQRREVLKGVIDYVHFLGSGQAEYIEADPNIQLREGLLDPNAPEDALAVILKSPSMTDPELLEGQALRGMKGMAKDLAYKGKVGDPDKKTERILARTLEASVSAAEGILLTADINSGASLATVDDHDPESGFIYLHARNLSSPAQSLICLAGAIELVQTNQQVAAA